jgi:trehalose 6-phosphate phosphatase
MTIRGAFVCKGPLAIFLDVDGTLLEIAQTPDAVRVPAALRNTLQLASQRESGALALVSGRCIAELDRLFHPYKFPAAGQHGVERRDIHGNVHRPAVEARLLEPARQELDHLQALHAGLLLEDKGGGLAMHYRLAPGYAGLVMETMSRLAASLEGQYTLRTGKCVVELSLAGFSKRTAIEAFMDDAPFSGRTPVFIGDDETDEDGFEAVNVMGGVSIRVGMNPSSSARYRFSSVNSVIGWLRERNVSLPSPKIVRRRGRSG